MIKTGIDIIQISRLEEKVKNPNFASRIFTEIEMESDSISSLAGKFALKEAFFKFALGSFTAFTESID